MELKEGTTVHTSDGKDAGRLSRVVIDPETNEVTHVVIKRGLINKEDKVIAVDKIAFSTPDEVTLLCNAEELNEMSPLEIAQYVAVSGPRGGDEHFTNPAPERYVVSELIRTIPDELVALKEGAPVLSADHEQVGHIERVITPPDSGQVTYFIVSQGLLLKARKLVPIEWVASLRDDKVFLDVGTQQLKDLPPLQD